MIYIQYNKIIVNAKYNNILFLFVFKIDSVLFPVAEPLLVVQVCQRRAANQPVGRHRLHPVQQSEHDVSPFRSRRLGVEQFSRGKQTTTLLIIVGFELFS